MKNKEKLVRDLVNTFNDRDELHAAYKERMKDILLIFALKLSTYAMERENDSHLDMEEFVHNFVETHFKPHAAN